MRVAIEFEVDLSDIEHTEEELEEYLRFYFRDNGSISIHNPFEVSEAKEPEPIFGTFDWRYA